MTTDDFPMAFERAAFEAVCRERDDAQEAAEEYWEAWQDAAVYWKEKVERLQMDLEHARSAAAREVHRHLNAVLGPGYETLPEVKAERDRLCEALKTYGAHNYECDRIRLDGDEDPSRSCTCGFVSVLENH
jgi:ferric-dicitrate binding protein FerR (iron transport regulator)